MRRIPGLGALSRLLRPRQPQGPILSTDYDNPIRARRFRARDWPSRLVGGKTFMTRGAHRYDWVQVLDPENEYESPTTLVGVSGIAMNSRTSPLDNPFLHPLGHDFEFYIAPDPAYAILAAPVMKDAYREATERAKREFGLKMDGVVGMEVDEKMVPKSFRARDGSRVVVFGRWIVDTGHDDFHTEIHPPLLIASGFTTRSRQQEGLQPTGGRDATVVAVWTRPYLVSQEFTADISLILPNKRGLFVHLLDQFLDTTFIPTDFQLDAHPTLLPTSWRGMQSMIFTVRPPSPRSRPEDVLFIEHALVRRSRSVAVAMVPGDEPDTLRVLVVLNENGYQPPPVPERVEHTVTQQELMEMEPEAGEVYREVANAAGLTNFGAAKLILDRGIKSTKFVRPPDPVLPQPTRVPLPRLRQPELPIDENMPWPVIGTIRLEWQRGLAVPGTPPVLGGR